MVWWLDVLDESEVGQDGDGNGRDARCPGAPEDVGGFDVPVDDRRCRMVNCFEDVEELVGNIDDFGFGKNLFFPEQGFERRSLDILLHEEIFRWFAVEEVERLYVMRDVVAFQVFEDVGLSPDEADHLVHLVDIFGLGNVEGLDGDLFMSPAIFG